MTLIRTISKQKNGQYVMTVPAHIAQSMLGEKTKLKVEIEPVSSGSFIVKR